MAPPGRRKPGSPMLLPVLLLLLLTSVASAASAALGIDFGTEYLKAAIAKPGSPIEIVLTKDSKRKEAATLAFKPSQAQTNDKDAYPERLYGGDAIAVSARYPADVFSNLKTVLGVSFTDEAVKEYEGRFPGLRIEAVERQDSSVGSVGFVSPNLKRKTPLMVEELLAMEFKNIKTNAEAAVGKNSLVTDVVITIPAYYTASEKRAVEQAAELAGLRVLGLISDGLSVGLNYATNRATDAAGDGGKPEYHLVYDMGAGSTTATLLKFHGKAIKGPGKRNQTVQEVQVLGTGSRRSFGGDTLNDVIVNDMIEKFLDTPKVKKLGVERIHVRKNGKSMARMWKDAEKLRQVLSANNQASASFEGLHYEDINFRYSLTRAEFQALAKDFAGQVSEPLQRALEMAGVSLADVDSIILHGGMTRTPFIQQELEKYAGGSSKVKTNVNADEAAVFGAAFKAAGLSPSFRVKDIRTVDVSGSDYSMMWNADGKERQQKIFLRTSQTGQEKQVTIKATEDFTLEFSQTDQSTEARSEKIVAAEATNLTKSSNELKNKYGCATSNMTTVFNVRLSSFNGLPEIVSGSISCKAEKVKDGGVIDNVKGLFGFGSKKSDQEPLNDGNDGQEEADAAEQAPLPFDDPTSSATVVSAASSTGGRDANTASESSTGGPTKATPSIVTIPLSVKNTVVGRSVLPKKSLTDIKQRLTEFDASDRTAALRSEALNVLEAFTYRARDYLDDEWFTEFATEYTRKQLSSQLASVSDWLYGDGVDAKLKDFKDKLKELKALVDPVLKRKEESGKRDEAIELLRQSLGSASSMIDMIKSSIENVAKDAAASASSAASSIVESVEPTASSKVNDGDDLDDEPYATTTAASANPSEEVNPVFQLYTEEDLSGITKVYDTIQAWLNEKVAAQGKLSPHDDPAFLVADLEARAKQLQSAVSDVIMKQIKMQQPPKAKKTKSTKKDKTKTKKGKSTTSGTGSGSSATASASAKDEL